MTFDIWLYKKLLMINILLYHLDQAVRFARGFGIWILFLAVFFTFQNIIGKRKLKKKQQ